MDTFKKIISQNTFLLNQSKNSKMNYKEKGNEEFKKKNYEKALEFYTLAIKEEPKNEIFFNNRAMTNIKLEKFQQAIADCDSALKIKKEFAKAHFNKGICLENLKNLDKARLSFEMAEKYEPSNKVYKEKLQSEKFFVQKKTQNQVSGEEINRMSKLLPKNSYYDVSNFYEEYKETNPSKKNLEFIKEAYSFRNSYAIHEFSLKQFLMDENYFLTRFGEISQDLIKFLKTAKPGSIRDAQSHPLQKNLRYSFSNSPKQRIMLTPGKTVVAIGFVDLSLFLNFQIDRERNLPIKFVGYDASLYSVVKTKIIITMIELNYSDESIVQVWVSSGWSLETKTLFEKAIEHLLKTKLPNEEKELLLNWKKENFTREESQELWKEHHSTSGTLADGLLNLLNIEDRLEYCEYWATGEVLKDNIKLGSSIMFSKYPFGTDTAVEETIFGMVELFQVKIKTTLFTAFEDYFIQSIRTLKDMVASNRLQLSVKSGFVEKNNFQLLNEIQMLNAYTMTWSNVPDYLGPKDFFEISKKCSCVETIHLFWSMNWTRSTFGTNLVDYPPEKRFKILKISRETVALQNAFPKFMRSAKITHPLNISGYKLAANFYQDWISHFFSKFDGSVHIFEKEYSPMYNPFIQAASEIYIAFSFSEQNLKPKQETKPNGTFCLYCRKESKELKKCSGCKTVSYCSKECQTMHWKEHKAQCQFIKNQIKL
jgi:tetratricopeptide (TPR) repeat protein